MAQLMPLPLTVSCFSKIQIGFTFLVPADPGIPEKGPLNVFAFWLTVKHPGLHSKFTVSFSGGTTATCRASRREVVVATLLLQLRRYLIVVHGSILCDPIQPNPSADLPNPTRLITSGKIWIQADPTYPNTTNNGVYSLLMTYFHTQTLSRTFSQPSINLFTFFTDRALNALT